MTEASPAQPALCVFDVCGTLYTANTTIGFVRFYHKWRGTRLRGLAADALTHGLSPARYGAHILGRASGSDLIRTGLLRTLAGARRTDLAAAAAAYTRDVLTGVQIGRCQRMLADHQARGERVMLMSNSIDPVIGAIADDLGVEFICSELGYADGLCTGRLIRDLTGAKHVALEAVLAQTVTRPIVHVITDNGSDRLLLDAADVKTVVQHGTKPLAALRGLEAEYVRLEG